MVYTSFTQSYYLEVRGSAPQKGAIMPSTILFALFIGTLFLPGLVALAAAILVRKPLGFLVSAVGFVVAVSVHAGIAFESYQTHPEWWHNNVHSSLGWTYFPAVIITAGVVFFAYIKRIDDY